MDFVGANGQRLTSGLGALRKWKPASHPASQPIAFMVCGFRLSAFLRHGGQPGGRFGRKEGREGGREGGTKGGTNEGREEGRKREKKDRVCSSNVGQAVLTSACMRTCLSKEDVCAPIVR